MWTLRGDLNRCGIADACDGVVKGVPIGRARRTRIRERDVFHRTVGRLDGPWVRIFQTAGFGDGELKLRRPAGADIRRVVIHGEPVTREAQSDMDEPDKGIEVEDIERLAAVRFRRIRIPARVIALIVDHVRIFGEIGHSAQHGLDHVADHCRHHVGVVGLLRVIGEDESHVGADNVLHVFGHAVVVREADLVHRGHDQIDLLGELVGIVPRRLAGKLEFVTEQRISRVCFRGGGPQQ